MAIRFDGYNDKITCPSPALSVTCQVLLCGWKGHLFQTRQFVLVGSFFWLLHVDMAIFSTARILCFHPGSGDRNNKFCNFLGVLSLTLRLNVQLSLAASRCLVFVSAQLPLCIQLVIVSADPQVGSCWMLISVGPPPLKQFLAPE